jgi:hypothetical protein
VLSLYLESDANTNGLKQRVEKMESGKRYSDEEARQISSEILNQLGGNKFLTMVVKDRTIRFGENRKGNIYIVVKLIKNKIKATELKVTLNGLDLYDMEFIRQYPLTLDNIMKGKTLEVLKVIEDLYFDQLIEVFERETALRARL